MKPRFKDMKAVVVAGVEREYADPEKSDPGFADIWMGAFMPRYGDIEAACEDKGFYGVWFRGAGGRPSRYLAGAAVIDRSAVPADLTIREVPGATYAVFECTVGTIGETYGSIFGNWLAEGGYEANPELPHFEYYPPETSSQHSPVFIHVPVVEARRA